MNASIKAIIDHMFRDTVDNAETRAFHEELLNNCLEHFKFRDAVKEAMNLARLGNKYLTDTEPWKVFKTDPQRVAVILNLCLQICANLSIAFEPFCPFS